MLKNKKANQHNPLNIILDIRSSSVGICFWQTINKRPTIIYTDRQYILFDEIQKNNDFIDNIYKTLDQVIEKVHKTDLSHNNNLRNIDNIMCVLSHPWYKVDIKNIELKEKKSRKLSKDYLNSKLKTIFNKEEDKKVVEIENKISSIYLNGYELSDPFNKEFEDIKISAYRGVIGKTTKEDLENRIKDNFKYKNIVFHTHPLSISSVLRNHFHSLNDFSLFNIGGEITEILNSENGSLNELVAISKGFNFLVRELSETINENKNSTFSKMKLLTEDELDDKKILAQIIKIAERWFEEINTKNKIKNNIFITIDKDFAKIIKKIFSNKDFYNNVLSLDKEPNIRIINSNNTKDLALYLESVEKDPILSILFNFQQLILGENY